LIKNQSKNLVYNANYGWPYAEAYAQFFTQKSCFGMLINALLIRNMYETTEVKFVQN